MEIPDTARNLTKSWCAYIAEGSTIIIGILLALSADAAWQYRNDRIEERLILEDLRSEFYQDVVEIEEDLRLRREKLERIELLGRVRSDTLKNADPGDIRVALTRSLLNSRFYAPNHAVLDDILSTGRLNLIQSDEIRQSIMAFEHMRATQTILENPARGFLDQISLYLADHLDLYALMIPDLQESFTAEEEIQLLKILEDEKFRSYLFLRGMQLTNVHRHSGTLLDGVNSVLAAIDQELGITSVISN